MEKLTDEMISNLQVSCIKASSRPITTLAFSFDGSYLFTANMDHCLMMYNCLEGRSIFESKSKNNGIKMICPTHSENAILHTSFNDCAVRYYSFYDNRYLRIFTGHSKDIISLSFSPVDDVFVTSSKDNSFQFWDLNSPTCIGVATTEAETLVTYDHQGLVCAVGINSECIKLYDVRELLKGPFMVFKYSRDRNIQWTDLKFSPNGATIIINTNANVVRLIDAFSGTPLQTFASQLTGMGSWVDVSFSPDSQYLVRGSYQSEVDVWNVDTGYKVATLKTDLSGPVPLVQFNPVYMLLACGGPNLSFLMPAQGNETFNINSNVHL